MAIDPPLFLIQFKSHCSCMFDEVRGLSCTQDDEQLLWYLLRGKKNISSKDWGHSIWMSRCKLQFYLATLGASLFGRVLLQRLGKVGLQLLCKMQSYCLCRDETFIRKKRNGWGLGERRMLWLSKQDKLTTVSKDRRKWHGLKLGCLGVTLNVEVQ